VIEIPNLNGIDRARLTALHHGRTSFEAFSFDSNGRKLTVWVFDAAGAALLLQANGIQPPAPAVQDAAPEVSGPPTRPPVAVRTGARAAPSTKPIS
jgi:hypothetical protein